MLSVLAVVASVAALPVGSLSADASHLELTLNASKRTYVLHEHVVVTYVIENPTTEAITSLTEPVHGIDWVVTDPTGRTLKQQGQGPVVDYIQQESVHEAGSFMRFVAELGPTLFGVPGEYRLRARLFAGGSTDVFLESNEVQLEMREPAGVDAEAIAYFASEEQFEKLIRGGAERYCRDRDGVECFDDLSRFVQTHQKSAYMPQIVWNLANTLAGQRLGGKPRGDDAVGYYQMFLDKWGDHPDAPKVMYGLVMALDRAGRYAEAARMIERFEEMFPLETRMARLLRSNVKSGGMVGPTP